MSSTTPQLLQSLIYKTSGSDTVTATRTLQVLDQLRLPKKTVYIEIPNVAEAFSVIQKMQIRGEFMNDMLSLDWLIDYVHLPSVV